MTLDEIAKRLAPFVKEWPTGSLIWHRADGRRGILMGYSILHDGEVSFRVDWGGSGWANEKPASVRASKPAEDDGDEWKEGAGV